MFRSPQRTMSMRSWPIHCLRYLCIQKNYDRFEMCMCVCVLIPYLSTEFNSVWKRSSFLTDASLRSARISDINDRNHLSTAPGMNPNGNTSRTIGHIDISISFMPPNSVGWKIFRPISRNSDLTSVKHCGSMLNEQRITFWVANREASYNKAQEWSKW